MYKYMLNIKILYSKRYRYNNDIDMELTKCFDLHNEAKIIHKCFLLMQQHLMNDLIKVFNKPDMQLVVNRRHDNNAGSKIIKNKDNYLLLLF